MLRHKRPPPPPEEEELERPKYHGLIRLFGFLVVIAFLILTFQLYQIQIVQGNYFRTAADTNRFRLVSTSAPRGVIYDRSGQILVHNEPSFNVSLVPIDLPPEQEDQVLKKLSAMLDVPLATSIELASSDALGSLPSDATRSFVSPTRKPGLTELVDEGRRTDPYSPVLLQTDVPRTVAFTLQEESLEFPGLRVGIDPVRNYPYGSLLGDLLGYVGHIPREQFTDYQARGYQQTDQVGLVGIELTYEDQLRGQAGQRHVEVDASGNEIRLLGEDPAVPGDNLYLALNVDFQRQVEAALEKGLKNAKSQQGVAIVEDVNTGEILALVNIPSYDDNLFARGIKVSDYQSLSQDPQHPLVDHAISGQYPPGSVFKLVAASGALQEGVIDDKATIFAPGEILVPNKYFPDDPRLAQPFFDWYRPGFGALTIVGGLTESSDVFFYKLVGGYTDFPTPLGQNLESEYARLFGFDAPLGIDLPGEAPGLIPDPQWKRQTWNEAWVTGDTYNMAIGQGFVLATPLQILNMTNVVANGGIVYRPHLVHAIVNAQGTLTNTVAPQILRRLPVDPKYFAIVREGMRGAVTHGTAWKANLADVAVAAKTGTAEFPGTRINGYLPTHAWFTAFAPYDKPQIALVVFIAGGGQGSEVAAPVAADILRAYFHLAPDAALSPPTAAPPPPESRRPLPASAGAPPPAPPQPNKFAGSLVAVEENTNSERPIFYGNVVDALGHGLSGVTLAIDPGNGNTVLTTTSGDGGAFRFEAIDFHISSHWNIRIVGQYDSAPLGIDVTPYRQYHIVFSASGG